MQQFDVIVVGKGNAALNAALTAKDRGAHVAMLEAASVDESGDLNLPESSYRHSYPLSIMINADGKRFVDEGIEPPKLNLANPLDTPPFEAYHTTCGVTFTFGGLRINPETGQVLDVNMHPIPGLYTAGEMVGGLFYFNYPAGTGLVSGTVFGRIAGAGAAALAA